MLTSTGSLHEGGHQIQKNAYSKTTMGAGGWGMQSVSLFELAMGIVGIVNITVVDSC